MRLLSLDLSIASTGYSVFIDNRIIECDRIVTEGTELSEKSKKHLDYTHFLATKSEDDRIYFLSKIIDKLTKKYNIVSIQPVDMFPFTAHVETVVSLSLKIVK